MSGEIWVVIPGFNEQGAIGGVVQSVTAAGYPVVVVDDGSRDGTGIAAQQAGARVLFHVLNRGQGAALQTGIDFAVAQGAKTIVTLDADGQHRLDDVPALVAAVDAGADIALGSRFLGGIVGATRGRRLLLRVSRAVSNLLCGLPLTDAHCGIRAIRASSTSALRITQDRMAHASEILSSIRRSRLRWVEVPVTISYTAYSQAKGQGWSQAIRILFDYFARR